MEETRFEQLIADGQHVIVGSGLRHVPQCMPAMSTHLWALIEGEWPCPFQLCACGAKRYGEVHR